MNDSETLILIVEDEALIAQDLKMSLKKMGYSVLGIAHSAEKAVELSKKSPPALALLDVNISGAINGIMLASILKDEFKIPFIFLTSYTDDETLSKANSLNPANFIVKPYDHKQLQASIKMALNKVKETHGQSADWKEEEPEAFYVKQNSNLIRIGVHDIFFIQAFDNYCFVVVHEDKFLIPHTLKSVEEKLANNGFYRIHRSYLANLKKIEVIGEDSVIMGKYEIPISRASKNELIQKINLL